MSTGQKEYRKCDVEGCGQEAIHECANCGDDICNTGHTHSYGDGGHIEHSVHVSANPFPHHGYKNIYLCPKCYVNIGLWKLIEEKGV